MDKATICEMNYLKTTNFIKTNVTAGIIDAVIK